MMYCTTNMIRIEETLFSLAVLTIELWQCANRLCKGIDNAKALTISS